MNKIVVLVILLLATSSYGKKHREQPAPCNCYNILSPDVKNDRWYCDKDGITRRYNQKDYELIDSSYLFVYRYTWYTSYALGKMHFHKRHTIGCFSWDARGEVFEMNEANIQSQFIKSPMQMSGLLRTSIDSLIQKDSGGLTKFNEICMPGCHKGAQRP